MSDAEDLVVALRSEHEKLAAIATRLDGGDLARSSGSREWSVAQVLSHLGSGSVITLAVLESSLGGTTVPDDLNQQVWQRWDAMTPAEQAAEFVTANRTLVERYESIPSSELISMRVHFAWMPAPLRFAEATRMRLNEVALHSWDVRVAFDDDAVVSPEAVPQLMKFVPSLVGRIAKPDALNVRPATVEIVTTDPASSLTLVLGDQAAINYDHPASGENKLTLPAEAWIRLVTGRLAPAHTPSSVASVGPVDLDALRHVFPGY